MISMQVCMVLYIFGDLRQLRKFELARPPISRPRAMSNPQHLPVVTPSFTRTASGPVTTGPITQPLTVSVSQSAPESIPYQPGHLDSQATVNDETTRARTPSSSSAGSSLHTTSSGSGSEYISSSSAAEQGNPAELIIEVSSVVYDDFPDERPLSRPQTPAQLSIPEFIKTASFKHPYDPLCDDDFDGMHELSPEERQDMEPFDFDLLPKRGYTFPQKDRAASVVANDTMEAPSIAKKNGGDAIAELRSTKDTWRPEGNNHDPSTDPEKSADAPSPSLRRPVDATAHFKAVNAVPIFASVTPVWSTVVARAQWEIVVRSAAVAGLICWIVIGCLLAVPDSR
jgi:hypothetical protein